MTRQSTKQRGISLVEVMLTLALSSLLLASVLAGRNSLRSQAQFSDGMERIKETILTTKNQANTGNNTVGQGNGTPSSNNTYLTIGRSVQFTLNSSNATTNTLLCNATSDLLCATQIRFPFQATQTQALPWGITYTGCTNCGGATNSLTLLFVRDDNSGTFSGYWFPGALTSGIQKSTVYRTDRQTPLTLNFRSPDGRTATINVNPAAGTVTRTIQ